MDWSNPRRSLSGTDKMLKGLAREVFFRANAVLFAILPFKLGVALTIYVRRASARDLLDNHFIFFYGRKLGYKLRWLTNSWLSKKYWNEIIYLLLITGHYKEVLSHFNRIDWVDLRGYLSNRLTLMIDRYVTGYSMDLVARFHMIRWTTPQPVAQRALSDLLIIMLEHRQYDFEERIFRGRVESGELISPVLIDDYVPHFFRDKELVGTLANDLHLEGIETTIAALDAKGQYWESFPADSEDRPTLVEISTFFAYRHLTLYTYHNGEGHLVPSLCKQTLATQRRLRPALPAPSSALRKRLDALGIENLADVRLLSPDWSALIGHCGHLNVHLMMREMGWWRGKPLLLAYKRRIANWPFLSLFEELCPTLVLDGNVSSALWNEIASLTPFLGVSHQIFEFDDGRAMYWNDAGGMAVAEWEAQNRGFPLRNIYDRKLLADDRLATAFYSLRTRWGMTPTDWHVCLHMRESNTRGEKEGVGESIRNTSLDNYTEAIRFITSQGGWVVRMGGPKTARLPKMDRVIDYAHYAEQSPEMDIHLMRTARMFIGTTSGFAYVASSFGIPTAMVNAISSVGLLWSTDTRFTLKPVRTKEGRLLTQREVTSEEWRWAFPTHESLAHAGLTVSENTADEILEAVRETFALTLVTSAASVSPQIEAWRASVSIPGFYGAATPSAYFLEKYGRSFLPEDQCLPGGQPRPKSPA
jgi:putative glycosyltransferase (TIGR04372 family)